MLYETPPCCMLFSYSGHHTANISNGISFARTTRTACSHLNNDNNKRRNYTLLSACLYAIKKAH